LNDLNSSLAACTQKKSESLVLSLEKLKFPEVQIQIALTVNVSRVCGSARLARTALAEGVHLLDQVDESDRGG
jgi:hypothetical protein